MFNQKLISMKKLNYLFVLLAAFGAFMFTSCEDDSTEDPITITAGTIPASVSVGDVVAFNISIVSQEKIESIEVRKGTSTIDELFDIDNTSHVYPFSYTAVEADAGETLQFSVIVTDKKENEKIFDFSFEVTGGLVTYSAVLMGDFGNPSTGSFYATSTNQVLSQANAKANASIVDFVYFYGVSNGPTIAAPNDADAKDIFDNASTGIQTWSVENATKFKDITGAQFDGATTTGNVIDLASGASASKANTLAAGDAFAFVTAAGKSGVVKVTEITGVANGTGTIKIDVKVEE